MPPETYEFLIVAKNEAGSTLEIISTFSKFDIELSKAYVYNYREPNRRVFGAFCDFSKAKIEIVPFSEELKKLPSVVRVEFDSSKNRMFDRFFFPIMLMDKHRAVLMRVDSLLNMEKNLTERMGSAGSAIMFDEGVSYAEQTVGHYREILPSQGIEVVLRNITDGLIATGWGFFDFKETEKGYFVSIRHPPRLENGEMAENRFILGLTAGIFQALFGGSWSIFRSHYDPSEDVLNCGLKKA